MEEQVTLTKVEFGSLTLQYLDYTCELVTQKQSIIFDGIDYSDSLMLLESKATALSLEMEKNYTDELHPVISAARLLDISKNPDVTALAIIKFCEKYSEN